MKIIATKIDTQGPTGTHESVEKLCLKDHEGEFTLKCTRPITVHHNFMQDNWHETDAWEIRYSRFKLMTGAIPVERDVVTSLHCEHCNYDVPLKVDASVITHSNHGCLFFIGTVISMLFLLGSVDNGFYSIFVLIFVGCLIGFVRALVLIKKNEADYVCYVLTCNHDSHKLIKATLDNQDNY